MMKPNRMQKKRNLRADNRIISLAVFGGLNRIPGGITVERLAAARCRYGFTALHYAARFGHLCEIPGGATVAQLGAVRSHCDWILEYIGFPRRNAAQVFSGRTALSVAITFGHLDQVREKITLAKLLAQNDKNGRTAMSVLDELIKNGEDPVALGHNIVACPEILGHLSTTNAIHISAVRIALSRNHNLESLLQPNLLAALL